MAHNFRFIIILTGAVLSTTLPIEVASAKSDDITISVIDKDSDEWCGMTISNPNVENVFHERLMFGCTGNYEFDGGASLKMDFQFNPNDRNGGEYIGFFVRSVSISETAKLRSGFLLRTDENKSLDKFSGKIIYKTEKTYCDLSISTKITRIQGFNWHGWLAEESYTGKPRPHCTVSQGIHVPLSLRGTHDWQRQDECYDKPVLSAPQTRTEFGTRFQLRLVHGHGENYPLQGRVIKCHLRPKEQNTQRHDIPARRAHLQPPHFSGWPSHYHSQPQLWLSRRLSISLRLSTVG